MRPALLVASFLTVSSGACAALTAPPIPWPTNVQAFAPPARYAAYWREMEDCSGITADFGRVTWYRADSLLDLPGLGAFGYTDWRQHRIALDGRIVRHEADSVVLFQPDPVITIRHEMLHELLQRDGHPPEYFGEGGQCWDRLTTH